MAGKLAIDETLLRKAQRMGGFQNKKETVAVALKEFIERREQKKILQVLGTIDFRKDWDYKKER